jgi:hypothetical protein
MGAPKPRTIPEPRLLTDVQVAARLNCSCSWLSANKLNLYRAGMPKPDQLLGGKTDAKALEAWLDRRSGLIDDRGDPSEPDISAERVGANGNAKTAVHRQAGR